MECKITLTYLRALDAGGKVLLLIRYWMNQEEIDEGDKAWFRWCMYDWFQAYLSKYDTLFCYFKTNKPLLDIIDKSLIDQFTFIDELDELSYKLIEESVKNLERNLLSKCLKLVDSDALTFLTLYNEDLIYRIEGRMDNSIMEWFSHSEESVIESLYNRMAFLLSVWMKLYNQFLSVYGDTLRELAAEEEQAQSPVEEVRQESEVWTVPEIPIELQSPDAKRILGWMIEGGLISENYGWKDSLKTKRKLSYLCWRMSQVLKLGKNDREGVQDISWRPFEVLFKTTGLGNNFNQLVRDRGGRVEGSYPDIDKYF